MSRGKKTKGMWRCKKHGLLAPDKAIWVGNDRAIVPGCPRCYEPVKRADPLERELKEPITWSEANA